MSGWEKDDRGEDQDPSESRDQTEGRENQKKVDQAQKCDQQEKQEDTEMADKCDQQENVAAAARWDQQENVRISRIQDDVLLAEPAAAYRDHQDAFMDAALRGLLFDERWEQIAGSLSDEPVDERRTAELVEVAEREGVMGFAPEDLVDIYSALAHFEAVTAVFSHVEIPDLSIAPAETGDALTDTNGRWEVVDSSSDTLPPASVPPISQAQVIALPSRSTQLWRGVALAALVLLAAAVGVIVWLVMGENPGADREASAHEASSTGVVESPSAAYEADVRNRCLEGVETHLEAVTVAQPVWHRLNLSCARALDMEPASGALQNAYDETLTAQMWLRYYQTARNHLAAGECAAADLELSSIGVDAYLAPEAEKTRDMVASCLEKDARIEELERTDADSNPGVNASANGGGQAAAGNGSVGGVQSPTQSEIEEARYLSEKALKLVLSNPQRSVEFFQASLAIVEDKRVRASYAFALERAGKICQAYTQYQRVLPLVSGQKKKRAEKAIADYRDTCE